MQSTLAVLSGGRGAGRGWGGLSPLCLCVRCQGSFPLPWTSLRDTSRVRLLVWEMYMMCWVLGFFKLFGGDGGSHSKTCSLPALGMPLTPSFAPEVPSRPPTSRPKPDVPCPGAAWACSGPSRGRHSHPQEGGPACSSPLPCRGPRRGCSSVPSLCNRGAGWAPSLSLSLPLPVPSQPPPLLCLDLHIRFSKPLTHTHTKYTKKNKKIHKNYKKNLKLSENYYLLY